MTREDMPDDAWDETIEQLEEDAGTLREAARAWADLCNYGWTIICNVSEGDWTKQPEQWQDAAARFRDEYHALLDQKSFSEIVDDGTIVKRVWKP